MKFTLGSINSVVHLGHERGKKAVWWFGVNRRKGLEIGLLTNLLPIVILIQPEFFKKLLTL